MIKGLYIIVMIFLVLISCKKESSIDDVPKSVDYSYFNLVYGVENQYYVEEITIDKPSNYYDTVTYYLKVRVDSAYYDSTGTLYHKIIRYKKQNPQTQWQISDIWAASATNNMATVTEENYKYVKIRFPLVLNNSWNGNIFNVLDLQEYTIVSLDEPYQLQNQIFDSVLTVEQMNNESLINKYYTYEKYAKNKGLIERKNISISYADVGSLPIEQRVVRGTLYYQTLIPNL